MKRLDNIPEMSWGKYVKEELLVEVIMDLIEGSQDDVCRTQLSLQFMLTSRTETSNTWNPTDWVGPPDSVVKVVVVDEAIRSYISVHCKKQGIHKLTIFSRCCWRRWQISYKIIYISALQEQGNTQAHNF